MRLDSPVLTRARLAWHLFWDKEVADPISTTLEPWYERLTRLVNSPLSQCCKQAVLHAEKEGRKTNATPAQRIEVAQTWARLYAQSAGLHPDRIRPGTITFLLEWWVAYLGGRF